MDWRYSNTINTITLSSFNHIATPLFHFSSSFLSPLSLICCLSQIDVDWRSTSTVWTEDRRWQRGGLVIDGDGMVVWSGGEGEFSFSNSDSLFLSLRFSLSDWMWVLVLLWIFVVGIDARFMVAVVGGYCVVGGDGFTVGLRRLL